MALDGTAEFLTTFTLVVPPEAGSDDVTTREVRESARTRELAGQARLLRPWKLVGDGRSLGHRQVPDAEKLASLLRSLPMADWLTVETLPLTRHPSDPASRVEQ